MYPDPNSITGALSDEIWELPPELGRIVAFFEKLPFCWLQVVNGELSYTWLSRCPIVLLEESGLSFPELGLTLNDFEVAGVIVRRHPVHAGMVRVSITSPTGREKVLVDAPAWAEEAISELSRNVVQTHSLGDKGDEIERVSRKLCKCCDERRRKTQQEGESHPLYHLLSTASLSESGLRIDVEGELFCFSTHFDPLNYGQDEGKMFLGASRSKLTLDLSEFFRAVARVDTVEQARCSIIDCYHSYGDLLLSVSQEGDELYELWSSMAKRAGSGR